MRIALLRCIETRLADLVRGVLRGFPGGNQETLICPLRKTVVAEKRRSNMVLQGSARPNTFWLDTPSGDP
jgi:hypothetical protein